MQEIFEHLNINKKRIVEKKTLADSIDYERFFFTKQEIEKLKKLGFPFEIDEQTLITELHLHDVNIKLSEFRKTLKKISEGKDGYTIGVSWIAPILKRFGFKVQHIAEDVVKDFPAGKFIKNQDKTMKRDFERLERLKSRQAVDTGYGIINTLGKEELEELKWLEDTLVGYEKIAKKLGRKINYSDVQLAWIENKDIK